MQLSSKKKIYMIMVIYYSENKQSGGKDWVILYYNDILGDENMLQRVRYLLFIFINFEESSFDSCLIILYYFLFFKNIFFSLFFISFLFF